MPITASANENLAEYLNNGLSIQNIRIALKKLFLLGSRTVCFFRFRFGLGSTAVSNFGSVPVKVQIN